MEKDKRFFEKPKYKIGDIIVYKDRYKKDVDNIIQSKITAAYAIMDIEDKEDCFMWFYSTEEIEEEKGDNLTDEDILYKLD